MEAKNETQANPTEPPPIVPVAPPSHGGSYTLDDATGEHTLIARTQTEEKS